MLEEIRIRGLGVIEEAVLSLSPGFTAITGETGAGKTMVVTSLGLLFGGRPDAARVRAGVASASVEGRIVVNPTSAAAKRAAEAGAELDDGALLLARTVSPEGRSRGFVGGRSVPAAVLAELAEELIAVHGQSDQQRLLRPARQRAALDRFAGEAVAEPLARYSAAYERLHAVERTLAEMTTQARDRLREADLLRDGLERIDAVAPRSGEEQELLAEESRLSHADELRAATTAAHDALSGGSDDTGYDAGALVGTARRHLDGVAAHDPLLERLAERVREVSYLLADLAGDLASYTDGIETDPARLAAVSERRAALAALNRRYGDTVAEVLEWADSARRRLLELDGDDERVAALDAERGQLRGVLGVAAAQLSAARTAAAERFAAAVTVELAGLALPHARLVVAVRQRVETAGLQVGERTLAYGPSGVDDVELLLEPHPGAEVRSLARGASGGELSRVMLAVEVVFAGADPVPTLVFDEVDAGVGGKAALEVGRRLAALAHTAQVVVVTHLPQVAAFADAHLTVVKSSTGEVTSSGIEALDAAARVRELARMLAGQADSASARAHAEELLATAAQERRTDRAARPLASARDVGPAPTGPRGPARNSRRGG